MDVHLNTLAVVYLFWQWVTVIAMPNTGVTGRRVKGKINRFSKKTLIMLIRLFINNEMTYI